MSIAKTSTRRSARGRPRTGVPVAAWPWGPAWMRWLEIGWTAPQVIAHRTQRMWLGGAFPDAVDRAEFRRMFDEKGEAWSEAMLRASIELWKLWFAIASSSMQAAWRVPASAGHAAGWRSVYRGAARRWARSAPHVAYVGLGPVHRRVTANARRLSRFRPH